MSNVDQVTEHILKNSKTLSAGKIVALGMVIKALGGDNPIGSPNEVKQETTLLDEEQPMKLSDIDNIEIDGVGSRGVKIYQ
jgi:hypothetical protein